MAKKITKLTPEQIARFGEWSKQWIDIGLSTEPADFDKATEAALRGYALANLKKPMVILRMSSPYGAVLGGALAWAMLRELVSKGLTAQVGAQVRDQVRDQVRGQVGDQVRDQVWDQVGNAVYNSFQAQYDAGFGAWITYFRDVCGWSDPSLEKFDVLEMLIKSCGWVWWHENVLTISDRPTVINRDNEGRLHCETGPSIAYRDGWQLYHWHGTSVPAEWIEDRKSLTPAVALKQENVEQRRAACEILGWANILRDLKAKAIDHDDDPQIGDLVQVNLPDLSQPAKFLRVQCGTGREFAIGIPPHINKALDAQAWIVGLNPKDFQCPEVRA